MASKRRGRRPAKPKRKHKGIKSVFSGGRWKWRGVLRIGGVEDVGPLRDDQDEAHEDYRKKKQARAILPSRILTLEQAVQAVLADADQRGLARSTIDKHLRSHGKYLMRFWKPDTPLTRIDRAEVSWFIGEAQRASRSVNTLNQKDIPMLRRCFEIADLPSPTDKVQKPKYVPPAMQFFEMAEVAEIVERMRGEEFRDKRGNVIQVTARERHADLVMLLALTGLRSGELARVAPGDVDMKRQRISVVSQDRGHPRYVEITEELLPAIRRLLADARGGRLVPGGMSTLSNMFRHWQRRLGEPRLNGRALRHTFVTALLYEGVDAVEVKGLAGHRSLATTSRYVHEITDRRARAAATLDKFFDSAADESRPGPRRAV